MVTNSGVPYRRANHIPGPSLDAASRSRLPSADRPSRIRLHRPSRSRLPTHSLARANTGKVRRPIVFS